MNQDKDQLTNIGARIRKLRDTQGLNLHELARLCGISAPALSLIETGKRDLRVSSLLKIASALRVSAAVILIDSESDKPDEQKGSSQGYDLSDYS